MLQQPNEYGVFLDAVALPRSHTRFRIQCPLWNKRRALDWRRTIEGAGAKSFVDKMCMNMRGSFSPKASAEAMSKTSPGYDSLVQYWYCYDLLKDL